MYRTRKGTWVPPILDPADVVALTATLSAQALIRAYDYMDGSIGQKLSVVESAFPLWVWSAAIAAGAVTLLVGLVQKRHLFVWASHAWLLVWYIGLCAGYLLAALDRPNVDGIWFAGVMITPIALHLVFLLRSGPNPLAHEKTRVVEEVRVAAPR